MPTEATINRDLRLSQIAQQIEALLLTAQTTTWGEEMGVDRALARRASEEAVNGCVQFKRTRAEDDARASVADLIRMAIRNTHRVDEDASWSEHVRTALYRLEQMLQRFDISNQAIQVYTNRLRGTER